MEYERDDELELGEEGLSDELKKLREKLKVSQAERQEYLETSQRLRADYVNLKRHGEAERDKLAKFASEGLIKELVGLADHFAQATADSTAWESLPAEWRQGMEQIASELAKILKRQGVETINPEGEEFDPVMHQAVGMIDTEKEKEDNKVLLVMQRGYKLHDKVIRPASVKVGRKI
jgi:molecular chaperone GrpE